jgi:hypothetical protein
MKTDAKTGRVYIYDPDTYLGNDEIFIENFEDPNAFWDWVPFG